MLRDFVNGLRAAGRAPGFTLASVLLVGLGIGANTAIFTVARALVFQPLPFEQPHRLVSVWRESPGGAPFGASWPHLRDWAAESGTFDGVAAYIVSGTHASADAAGANVGSVAELQVTDTFFPLLGVRPLHGRLFSRDEMRPEQEERTSPAAVVLGHEFWQQRLHGRRDVVGCLVSVGGAVRVVVGVLPPGIRLFRSDKPEVFSPLRPYPDHLADRSMTYLQVIARLRPGVDIAQARAAMVRYTRRAAARHPLTDAALACRVDDLHDRLFGSMRPVMSALLAASALVLLIACANLAMLLLVRATRRRREISIRAALGAGRIRIARQLLAESLVLALAGGGTGLILAAWCVDILAAFCRRSGIPLPELQMNAAVLAFTTAASLGTGLLLGAAPAWHAWRCDVNAGLKSSGAGPSDRSSSRFLGGSLAVAEIALSAVLLIAAGLVVRSFVRLNRVDPGFRPGNVLVLSIGEVPRSAGFLRREGWFWSELAQRAAALPGVRSVAFAGSLPMASSAGPENMKAQVTIPGRTLPPPGFLQAEYQDVSVGYFRTLGIPFRAGRPFDDGDGDRSAVVVNESFARECWGTEEALGRYILMPGGRPSTVVGVVGDVRQYGLRGAPPRRQIYRPLSGSDIASLSKWPSQYLIVGTSGNAERLAPALRDVVESIDPGRPVLGARTMEDVTSASTAWDRVKTWVVGLFGGSALLLTLFGLYAVVSHSISRRRREIAIRVALGGQPADIERLVLRQAAALLAAGLAIGIAAAFALVPLVSRELVDVSGAGFATVAGAALLLAAVGLVACYLPVRSAAKMDAVTVWQAE